MKHDQATKKDIVTAVCENTGYPRRIVDTVVDSMLENITKQLSEGNSVRFYNFGIFGSARRGGKPLINLATGEATRLPERTVPTFKPGKALKEAVNK